jgi:hypothetical protein
MSDKKVLRVVVAKRSKVKTTEFRLRPGELGLSLFRCVNAVPPETILDAVRSAGKRGDLSIVELPLELFRELGLILVATTGGTPDKRVNSIHVEARFPWWLRFLMKVKGQKLHEVFNERIAPKLAATAVLLGDEP